MIWCFNFLPSLVPMVESGSKRQTVRANRKDGRVPVVGDTVKLYFGLRSNQVRLLRAPTPITLVERIQIERPAGEYLGTVVIDGTPLSRDEIGEFALRDGFRHTPAPTMEFFEFFLPTQSTFDGFVVYWDAQ